MFGFLGAGNMAGALLEGVLRAHLLSNDEIMIFDINAARVKALHERLGVRTAASADELAKNCDMLLLGVKPDAVPAALGGVSLVGKALVSIVTGYTTKRLASAAPGARILRVMPNTPALVSAGMTALSLPCTLTEDEKAFAEALFGAVGRYVWVKESLIEAVVGVSGSGPAYAFLFLEAMADGGVAMGLPRAAARELAAQTLLGSAKMALESGLHTGELKDMVCSPAGTTIEAVRALEASGFRSAVMEAVAAAANKAEEMRGQ